MVRHLQLFIKTSIFSWVILLKISRACVLFSVNDCGAFCTEHETAIVKFEARTPGSQFQGEGPGKCVLGNEFLDSNSSFTIGAFMARVLQIIDAKGNQAAAEGETEQTHATADQPSA